MQRFFLGQNIKLLLIRTNGTDKHPTKHEIVYILGLPQLMYEPTLLQFYKLLQNNNSLFKLITFAKYDPFDPEIVMFQI